MVQEIKLLLALAVAGAVLQAQELIISPAYIQTVDDQPVSFLTTYGGAPVTCAWEVQDEEGVFTAPGLFRPKATQGIHVVRVRAVLPRKDRPEAQWPRAIAQVMVVGKEMSKAFRAVADMAWMDALHGGALPWWDLATARRNAQDTVKVLEENRNELQEVGFGLPAWPRTFREASPDHRLLSWQDLTGLARKDATGQQPTQIVVEGWSGPMAAEQLRRAADGSWESVLDVFTTNVNGVAPWTGAPAIPGMTGGPAAQARFQDPFGLAGLDNSATLITDRQTHSVWRIDRDGTVSPFCGEPGLPGFRNGRHARFHGPSYIRSFRPMDYPAGTWLHTEGPPIPDDQMAIVSDTGNNCLRALLPDGTVLWVAGQPGRGDWRDGDNPLHAEFHSPQGLDFNGDGALFLADQGNHCVRRIDPNGTMTTFAGHPKDAGDDPRVGPGARFTQLKGLACSHEAVWMLDGHALRRIGADGRVTTVAGAVGQPGFVDSWVHPDHQEVEEKGADRAQAGPATLAGLPCFRDPVDLVVADLAFARVAILISDTGNHTLRHLLVDAEGNAQELYTYAGEQGQDRIRYGLLRGFTPLPLDDRFAGVGAPKGLATCAAGGFMRNDLAVTSGHGVLRLAPASSVETYTRIRDYDQNLRVEAPARMRAGVPFQVACRLQTRSHRPIQWVVEFHEPDGDARYPAIKRHLGYAQQAAEGLFQKPGRARILARWVAMDGMSGAQELYVTVEAR